MNPSCLMCQFIITDYTRRIISLTWYLTFSPCIICYVLYDIFIIYLLKNKVSHCEVVNNVRYWCYYSLSNVDEGLHMHSLPTRCSYVIKVTHPVCIAFRHLLYRYIYQCHLPFHCSHWTRWPPFSRRHFSNAFSRMKIYEFRLRVRWSLLS